MITQRRVWELMSEQCKHKQDVNQAPLMSACIYYGKTTARYCKCETCPILGYAAIEIWKTGV